MNRIAAVLVLLVAALFEAGGDALMRAGLKQYSGVTRVLFLLGGGLLLAGYGLVVNIPDWSFGRLIGLYIVFFFVIAQLTSWLIFHQPPSGMTLAAGALILAGGAVLAVANV